MLRAVGSIERLKVNTTMSTHRVSWIYHVTIRNDPVWPNTSRRFTLWRIVGIGAWTSRGSWWKHQFTFKVQPVLRQLWLLASLKSAEEKMETILDRPRPAKPVMQPAFCHAAWNGWMLWQSPWLRSSLGHCAAASDVRSKAHRQAWANLLSDSHFEMPDDPSEEGLCQERHFTFYGFLLEEVVECAIDNCIDMSHIC